MTSLLPSRTGSRGRLRRDLLTTTALALGIGLAMHGSAAAQAYGAGGGTAGGTNSTAVGPGANAAGNESYAGGYNASAPGDGSVAIGPRSSAQTSGHKQGIINHRGGSATITPPGETDPAGPSPSGTAIGQDSTVGPDGGVAIGYRNSAGTGGFSSTAIGTNNNASGGYSVGIGNGNIASDTSSVAIGTANQATGYSSLAFGRESYATGDYSIAQGFIASAYGQNAIAFGYLSTAGIPNGSQTSNIAFGDNASAVGGSATALGSGASASRARSVAVGAGSTALRGTMSGTEAFTTTTLSSANPEFSVGASGAERQITNVAGGTQDTDAVNVRQLRSVGTGLATTLGGSYDANGTYTAPSYGYAGSTYSTVPGVIGAIDKLGVRYNADGSGNALGSIDLTRGGTLAGGNPVSITGLAPATTNTGAVNLSQMPLRYSTSSSPTTANPATPSNDVTLVGSSAGPVRLHNVAVGDANAGSTDAVNGGQLYTTNQNVTANSTGLTTLRNDIDAGTVGLVQQNATSRNITVGSATNGTLVDFTGTAGVRRLTGLADGTNDADAVTVGQLRLSGNGLGSALAQSLGGGASYDTATGTLTAPSYSVGGRNYDNVGSALTATNNLAVQYVPDGSGNPTGIVDLAKGGATTVSLRGVSAGRLNAGSTDAVNGDQLYTTNQQVAALQNGTAGLVQQATGSSPITVGAGTSGTIVNFTNTVGDARVLRGVAAGTVAASSNEAVNGGQLYGVTQNVTALQNGTAGLVQQDQTTRTIAVGAATDGRLVDLTGTDGTRRLAGLSSGVADTDAATVGQLRLGGQFIAGALGGGASYDPSTNTYTNPSYVVGGRTYSDVASALTASNTLAVQYVSDGSGNPTNVVNLARGGTTPVALRGVAAGTVAAGSTDAVNGGQLYTVSQSVADLQNGITGLVRQDQTTRAISVGGATDGTTVSFANQSGAARTVSGIAAGQIAAGSTEAVNGGQIYAVTASTARALGGGAGVASDGTLTAPSYSVQGSTYTDVGGALGGLDAAVTTLNTVGSRYVAVNTTGAAARATGADTVAIGPASLASADGSVALGANSVAGRAGMNGAAEAFSGTTVASTAGALSVGAAGAERQIINVAGGTEDTDAVNLRQLRAVGGNLAGALGGGAGFAADGSFKAPSYAVAGKSYGNVGDALGAMDTYAVKYDVDPATGGRGQTISLAGADPSQPVLIRNVAAGKLATDAANVGQVTQARADSFAYADTKMQQANAYTDARVAPMEKQMVAFGSQLAGLGHEVAQVRQEARRGAAIGLAAASLRFDDRPGKLSLAAGGGVWRGEGAASFGVGYTLPDGWARVNATGVAAGRDFGVGAGASFTLN